VGCGVCGLRCMWAASFKEFRVLRIKICHVPGAWHVCIRLSFAYHHTHSRTITLIRLPSHSYGRLTWPVREEFARGTCVLWDVTCDYQSCASCDMSYQSCAMSYQSCASWRICPVLHVLSDDFSCLSGRLLENTSVRARHARIRLPSNSYGILFSNCISPV